MGMGAPRGMRDGRMGVLGMTEGVWVFLRVLRLVQACT